MPDGQGKGPTVECRVIRLIKGLVIVFCLSLCQAQVQVPAADEEQGRPSDEGGHEWDQCPLLQRPCLLAAQ